MSLSHSLTAIKPARTSARKLITHLRARVSQLESELREIKGEPAPSSPGSTGTADSLMVPESMGLAIGQRYDHARQEKSASRTDSLAGTATDPCIQEPVGPIMNSGYDSSPPPYTSPSGNSSVGIFHPQPTDAPGPLAVDDMSCDGHAFMSLGAAKTTQDLPSPGSPQPDLDSLPETLETEDDITDILAARVGALRIAEDGELRYYGPTSNLHMHRNGSQALSQATIRHVEAEGSGVLRRLGLDRQVPLSIEMHLAKLYFSWEDPAIHVLDEDTFFTEKQNTILHGKKSPYYSETLNNAM